MAAVKAATRRSKRGSSRILFSMLANRATSSETPAFAKTTPTTAARATSRRPSVTNWRASRPRLAPMARRSAISCRRALARASSRLATFAQPISSTSPTIAITISNGWENCLPQIGEALRSGNQLDAAEVFPVLEPFPIQVGFKVSVELDPGRLNGRAVFQPADDAEPPALPRTEVVGGDRHGHGHLDLRARLEAVEAGTGDADDRDGGRPDQDRAAEDGRTACRSGAPSTRS